MAKLYGEIAAKALLTLDKSFARANGQPLDASEVYYSLTAAKEYAATAQAYIGQKIVVIENGVVTHYSVEDTAGNLKELGSKPVADGTTVAISEDGKITLANITETEQTGTYNAVLVNGELTWVKPSSTTVEGLSDLITALTGRVDTAEADIDALQASVGVASKEAVGEEGGEGYEPAVAATGLHKAVEDEIARAKAAEKALGERIDGIDFVDEDELATALEPYAKTADLPVTGIAADDKVLSLTDKLVSATVSLSYDEDNKAIKLYGKDNAELGSVDATPFIKDGMLDNVEYNAENNTLTFTWNTAAGKTEDTVVLSDIIEPYTAGAGLELEDNEFKAKLADGSESFLTITADGIKLAGIADAIATAKSEAITDAATAAAELYATKQSVTDLEKALDERLDVLEAHDHSSYTTNEIFNEYKTEVSNTYATQTVVNEISTVANNAATKVDTLEDKIDEITEVGGEPNVINYIKVNNVILETEKDAEGNSTKTVNVVVPTKVSDLTDDTGFDARITAAQNQADKAVNDASAANTAAAQAQSEVDALEKVVEGHGTTIASHTESIADYLTRITNLENADTQHGAEYNALKDIVTGHTTAIASKADQTALDAVNAKAVANETAITTLNNTTIPGINTEIGKKANSADVYTKTEIGTIAENKTLVQMIEDAKTAATYDDTAIKALIQGNTDAIAILNGDDTVTNSVISIAKAQAKAEVATVIGAAPEAMDTLEEVANWIANDESGAAAMVKDIKSNKDAIAAINNTESGILATANAYTDVMIAGLPFGSGSVAGLVKVDNKTIQAAEDGTISVKEVSTDLLAQGTQELILDGGNAGVAASV